MVPSGASSEEIAIFTDRVLNNVVDANGLRPGDPRFDRLTARFIENFAEGGLAGILEVGREGYAEGGAIYPRLSTLSSGVESAEQQLQSINAALQQAESNLGSGSSEGDTAITGGPSFSESFEETGIADPNQTPSRTPDDEGNNIYEGLGGLGTPEQRDEFKKQVAEDMNNAPTGLMKSDGTRVPITFENIGDGSNTMPSMPIFNKGPESFGAVADFNNKMPAIPLQTADPAREAYDKLQASVKEQRARSPYTRDVKYGENMTFEDFKKSYDAGTDPNQPTYSGPQLQGQLQSSGGGLMGSLGGFNVQKPVLSIGNTGQIRSPFAKGGLAKILEV
jgi:hypothetical protein